MPASTPTTVRCGNVDTDDSADARRESSAGGSAHAAAELERIGEWHLLSALAHEIRTPLSSLTASSELILADFETLERWQLRGMLVLIHRGALWLQNLAENLLCASTTRDGHLRISCVETCVRDIVDEIGPVVQPLLDKKLQRLRQSCSGQQAIVLADTRRVGQVLVNLVMNASKFSDIGAAIDLSIAHRNDRVCISVADRGPGVPRGHEQAIFNSFVQAGGAAASTREGVGLGLFIARTIVEAHGGRIGVEHRRGGGARFWFELPARMPLEIGAEQHGMEE
jgi:two-component system, OmpR family, sensor histidine kinase KdpD